MVLRDGHCSGEAIGTGPAVRYVAFFVWVVVVDEEPAYGALNCVARCVVRLCCTASVLGNHTPLEAGSSSILCLVTPRAEANSESSSTRRDGRPHLGTRLDSTRSSLQGCHHFTFLNQEPLY